MAAITWTWRKLADDTGLTDVILAMNSRLSTLAGLVSARLGEPVSNSIATTNATTTTLLTFQVPTGAVVVAEMVVIAKTLTPAGAGWTLTATFKNVAGTVTQIGATVASLNVQDAALATATAVFDVTGATFRIRATGVAATNIAWIASGDVTAN